jgi:hypothetical protein
MLPVPPWVGWAGLTLNLCACGVNLAMTVRTVRRYRRDEREFQQLQAEHEKYRAQIEQRVKSLLPAVGICAMLAGDEHVPEALRQACRAAVPDEVTVSVLPIPGGDRVH